jgi:hypothetical protein
MLPLHLEEEKVYTNQQAGISAMTRSKPEQPPTWSKAPLGRQRGLAVNHHGCGPHYKGVCCGRHPQLSQSLE